MTFKLAVTGSLVLLTGCSTADYYEITYATKPEGASIVCNGVDRGYSPVDLKYKLDEKDRAYGSFITRPCKAVWSSGASRNYDNRYDLDEFPHGVITTITRRSGEGLEQDRDFAYRLKQVRSLTGGDTVPDEYQIFLETGNEDYIPISNPSGFNDLIQVDSNLFYDVDSGSYTASPDPFLAPHIDPHVLPHTVPHVDPHWAPHNLPHILPHLK